MTIQELLRDAGVHVYEAGEHRHVQPGWLGIDCPFCGPNEARLGIPLARPVVSSCWSCGTHSVYSALLQIGGAELARKIKRVEFEDPVPNLTVGRGKYVSPGGIRELANLHVMFLRSRGLNEKEIMNVWQVKGIRLALKYSWSLFIPITLDGEVVSFTTRKIMENDRGARYEFAESTDEAIPAKSVLYGADLARNGVIINEGPLDAWRIGIGGTAILGLTYTREQVLQASRFPIRVVCLDAEPRAQQVAKGLCDQLSVFPGKTMNVVLDSGKDASRANEKEVRMLQRIIKQ